MNLNEKQKFLSSQPHPRTVRMSKRGRSWVRILGIVLAVVELGLILSFYFRWRHMGSFAAVLAKNGVAFYSALLLPFLPIPFYRGLLKQRELVRNGEVAIATVTSTSNSPSQINRNDDVRLVEYRFRVQSGDCMTGSSVDPTGLLRDGSAMLVYYDSQNPTEQISQCAGYYEVSGLPPDWIEEIG